MNLGGLYILVNRVPVAEPDFLKWALWKGSAHAEWIVAQEDLSADIYVSTVFLGLDANPFRKGPPLLFETMAQYRGRGWIGQWRCSTWTEAEAQHQRICADYRRHGEN